MNRGNPLAGSLPPVSKESFWACGRAGGRRRAEAIGSLDRQGLTARSGDAISGDQLRASARWAGGRREVKGRSRLAGGPGRVARRPAECRYSGLRSGQGLSATGSFRDRVFRGKTRQEQRALPAERVGRAGEALPGRTPAGGARRRRKGRARCRCRGWPSAGRAATGAPGPVACVEMGAAWAVLSQTAGAQCFECRLGISIQILPWAVEARLTSGQLLKSHRQTA